MSRGLGTVERAILAYLQLDKNCGGCSQVDGCTLPALQKNWNKPNWRMGAQIPELCAAVDQEVLCPHVEAWLNHLGEHSQARYQSVARAVRRLKEKGMVQTEPITMSYDAYGVELLWVSLP